MKKNLLIIGLCLLLLCGCNNNATVLKEFELQNKYKAEEIFTFFSSFEQEELERIYSHLPNELNFLKQSINNKDIWIIKNVFYTRIVVFFYSNFQLPDKTEKEREYLITKKYKTVFIIGIGNNLKNGSPHDKRAPDYDDWNLNGDLFFYHEVLDMALELSSMGIRVNKESLKKQLKISNKEERLQ